MGNSFCCNSISAYQIINFFAHAMTAKLCMICQLPKFVAIILREFGLDQNDISHGDLLTSGFATFQLSYNSNENAYEYQIVNISIRVWLPARWALSYSGDNEQNLCITLWILMNNAVMLIQVMWFCVHWSMLLQCLFLLVVLEIKFTALH